MFKEISNNILWNSDWCKLCGLCERVCPKKAITLRDGKIVIDSSKCISCGICEKSCPDMCIEVKKK